MHDFSAACWTVGAVLIWRLLARSASGEAAGLQAATLRDLVQTMRISVVGIVGFGAVRLWAYNSFEYMRESGDAQLYLLAIKHVLFTAVVVFGIVAYRRAARFIRTQGAS